MSKKSCKKLELMAGLITKSGIEAHTVYGFQISSALKELLLEIMDRNDKRFKGRMIFEIGNALQQEEIIHCNGSISTILTNQDIWFYANESFEPQMLFSFLNQWLKEETEKVGIAHSEIPTVDKWGEFICISWADLLDSNLFKNGLKTLEKLILSKVEDIEFDFIPALPKLKFHRVINEGESVVISSPVFPEKGTAFSYVLKVKIRKLEGSNDFIFTYGTSARLWIEEPVASKNKYLRRRETTNAYLYSTGILGQAKKVIYNQLSLRKKDGKLIFHRLAHEEFVRKTGINVEGMLEKELEKLKVGESQLLVTLPNRYRGEGQEVSRFKRAASSAYGVGIAEKENIHHFMQKQLSSIGLEQLKKLEHISSKDLGIKKEVKLPKLEMMRDYGVECYKSTEGMPAKTAVITEDSNIEINPMPFIRFDGEKSFRIAIFTANEVISDVLIGVTRMRLYADEKTGDLSFKNTNGVELKFDVFDENIASEILNLRDVQERASRIKEVLGGNKYDGAYIEVGDFNGSDTDPKHYLRAIFSEMNIKTQFIHPASIKNQEIFNRANAASCDLLSKIGFNESELVKYVKDKAGYISVTVIEYQGLKVPLLMKVNNEGVFYKKYEQTEWLSLDDLEQTLTQKYIMDNEGRWEKRTPQMLQLHLEWISKNLTKECRNKTGMLVIWDVRVNTLIPKYSEFRELLEDNIKDVLDNHYVVSYQYGVPFLDYLAWKMNGEIGKIKGIFKSDIEDNKWYLLGSRPKKATTGKDAVKAACSGKTIGYPTLCEVSVYSNLDESQFENVISEVQFLRLGNINYDKEAAYPYPLSKVVHIDEILEGMVTRYGVNSRKVAREEQKEEKIPLFTQDSLF